MSTHTIAVGIEIELSEDEVIMPMVEIEYDYERGYTPKTPRGEYAPIDPPVAAEVSFRMAAYVHRDHIDMPAAQLQKLAEEWLLGPGYHYACDAAETDLRAMRYAQ